MNSQYDFRTNLLNDKKNKYLSKIKRCDEELNKIYATLTSNLDNSDNSDNSITIDMGTQNDVLEYMCRNFPKEIYLTHKSKANVLFTVNYVKKAYDAIRNNYPVCFVQNYLNKIADPGDYKSIIISAEDQLEILDDMEDKFARDKYLIYDNNANNLFTVEYVKNAYDDIINYYPLSFRDNYLNVIVDINDRDKILDDLKNNLSKKDFEQWCNPGLFHPADNVRFTYAKFNIDLPIWVSEKYGELFYK